MIRKASFLALVALTACSRSADPVGPVARFELERSAFFDAPWPSDDRVDADGTIALSDFPDPGGAGLLRGWLDFGESQVGFGTNSPIYVAFEEPLDPARLPSPAESVEDGASVFLVDVDPTSPWRDERVPVEWQVFDQYTTWLTPGLLAVKPVPGFPLRPATRYALVVTTAAASPAPRMADVWEEAGFADLAGTLDGLGVDREEVAVATVFTTTDPLAEMARMARFVRSSVDSPRLSLPLTLVSSGEHFDVYRAHYPSPRFTHGERPYLSSGGGFVFGPGGEPVIEGWDDMRLAVCVPKDLSDAPAAGWPSAINQHGTGGDFLSHCSYDGSAEVAARLADAGIVTLGLDQPLHGTRDGGSYSDLANFNVMNADSGTANFRQGALDAIYLAHALASTQAVMRLPDGRELPLDPNDVLYLGHSQGGLTGALATPFFGGDVKAAVLSGAGGVLAMTLEIRTDPIDFATTFASLLGFAPGEEVTPFHPTMALVQTFSERTDPENYAPYWFAEEYGHAGQRPTSVLLTSGTEDTNTPYETALALGAAGRLPLLGPVATETGAADLRGLPVEVELLSHDAIAFDGTRVTAGMAQWKGGSHWVIWERDDAADLYQSFLQSAAGGLPILER